MKSRKKILLAILIALAVSLALPVAYSPWTPVTFFIMARRANQLRVELLCKTDFHALLAACRELSKRAAEGDIKPGTYDVRGGSRAPEASRFPQAILDLSPSYVYIDENNSGRVMLEMIGGLGHFGVRGYTENYKKASGEKYGDKELIPGLWYYDDNYVGLAV